MMSVNSCPPLDVPLVCATVNSLNALEVVFCGGSRAAFFSSLVLARASILSLRIFPCSVKGLFARFFGAAFFAVGFALFFAAFAVLALGFFASLSCFAASLAEVGALAARVTARFTGLEGSPTAFLGRPGVAYSRYAQRTKTRAARSYWRCDWHGRSGRRV